MSVRQTPDRFRQSTPEISGGPAHDPVATLGRDQVAALGVCPDCASTGQYVLIPAGAESCQYHARKPAESPAERSGGTDTPTQAGSPGSVQHAAQAAQVCAAPTVTSRRRRHAQPDGPPDGRYRPPGMVAVVCALPAGARRARDQAEALAVFEVHPATDELRVDRREHYAAIWRRLVHAADWSSLTFTGTWDQLGEVAAVSRSTVARALRWFRAAGLLGVVHTGASAAVLGGDVNRAPTYVLSVPAVITSTQAECPVETLDTPPVGDGLGVDPGRAREGSADRDGSAPLRGLDKRAAARAGRPSWVMSAAPGTRRDRLAAAEAILWQSIALRGMSPRLVRHVLRAWFDAGWSPADVLHALDHRPDGSGWSYTTGPRSAAAWVRYRLGHWRTSSGEVRPSRSQVARAEAEALRARRAAGRG